MRKRLVFLFVIVATTAGVVWGIWHRVNTKRLSDAAPALSDQPTNARALTWEQAVELVKADRFGEGAGAIETPQELRHYSERHWFLAAQVAEVAKYNVHTCQDYLELAEMIHNRELVNVPAVTNTYVLFGVGARANTDVFTRYQDDHEVELLDDAQLNDAYSRIEEKRKRLQSDSSSLTIESTRLKKNERARRSELQKQISTKQQELQSALDEKAQLDEFYGQAGGRQKLIQSYQTLQTLASNLNGRSFNLENPTDRQALKINLLSAIRPEGLKIIEEVADEYHGKFNRPLPISSLVRPEQYQHMLRRVNRNAVTIDTPPHSTGLAFDIDYRYMSAAEQTFLMNRLAEMKRAGRIEVIRESNANYHVFAFINGVRPPDDLIAASLEKAGATVEEAHHSPDKDTKVKAKDTKVKAKSRNTKSNPAKQGKTRRRHK